MGGHMGHERVTIKKLRVVRVDAERNLILVQGIGPRRARRAHLRPEGVTMPQTTLYDRTGAAVGSVDLAEALFAAPVNEAVLHQAVVAQLAGRRLGTSDTKTRGEVRGGGKKPYRQKGTGRARQGSRTAPHYRGGGVVFGPHPRSYEQKLPKKMRRLALRSAPDREVRRRRDPRRRPLRHGRASPGPRCSPACSRPSAPGDGHERRVLVVAPAKDEMLLRSAANLPSVSVILADSLNVVDLLNADAILIEQPALARMEEVYA